MMAVSLDELIQCLVACSTKAARIAQLFRDEHDLFELLVEEKSAVERNKRFVQDFKTLADVLVQETIRKDVSQRFPSLLSNIRGEEQNSFQNSLGECIRVELTSSAAETAALLYKVLDGRDRVAHALAEAVHAPLEDSCTHLEMSAPRSLPADKLGIWIDPIDSTAEYIQGKYDEQVEHDIKPYGLRCVCVLIGVYDLRDGTPIGGVVNQPFFHKHVEPSRWESIFYWAVRQSHETLTSSSLTSDARPDRQKKIALLSSSETESLKALIRTQYTVVHAAGSGYKSLLVACGKADLYILSQGTTYFWDTCGPQALLASQGGGIVKFRESIESLDISKPENVKTNEISYIDEGEPEGNKPFQNSSGIIAYRNLEDVMELVRFLRDCGYVHN